MPTLHVTHQKQQQQSDCLAACAYMVLAHLGVNVRYRRLLRLLNVQSGTGASLYSLVALKNLQVSVAIQDGNMDILQADLDRGQPVITAVDTVDLPRWDESMDHAIVVVGLDDTTVVYHDPWFADAPQIVDRTKFESAWLYHEYAYVVIQPSP